MSVEIIAEIGVNHQNDLDIAERLIRAAKESGADTAKFQASIPENETSALHAPDHLKFIAGLVPDFAFLEKCMAMCASVGIEFLCTPADEESLARLVAMGVKRLKIGSDNLNNPFVLKPAAESGLPLIVSTGMSYMPEVLDAWYFLGNLTKGSLTFLHCVSAYPAPVDQMNLRAMNNMAREFFGGHAVGLSDHTHSVTLPAVAVAMGAAMIEKHITLDRSLDGPDHQASLTPLMFKTMVECVREAELAMGSALKIPAPCEAEAIRTMRKSLVARVPIAEGDELTIENLTAKRPGDGYAPPLAWSILGKRARRAYQKDEQIQ